MAPKANTRKRKARFTTKSAKKTKPTNESAAPEPTNSMANANEPARNAEQLAVSKRPLNFEMPTQASAPAGFVNPLSVVKNPPAVHQVATSLSNANAVVNTTTEKTAPASLAAESPFPEAKDDARESEFFMLPSLTAVPTMPTFEYLFSKIEKEEAHNATTEKNESVRPPVILPGHNAMETRQQLSKDQIKNAIDSDVWNVFDEDIGMKGFNKFFNAHVKPLLDNEQEKKFERIPQLATDDPAAYRKKCMDEWRAAKAANRAAEASRLVKPTPVNDTVGIFATVRPPNSTAAEPGIVINWTIVLEIYSRLPTEAKNTRAVTYKMLEKVVVLESGLKQCASELRTLTDDVTAAVFAYNHWVDTYNAAASSDKGNAKVKKAESAFHRLRAEASSTCGMVKICCKNVDSFGQKFADAKQQFADNELRTMILYHKKMVSVAEMEQMMLGAVMA